MNPYTLIFGKEPKKIIDRYPGGDDIRENFESSNSHHVYMISGIRGAGKTVAMTKVANHFRNEDDWQVIDLSPDMNLLESFAAEMGGNPLFYKIFKIEKLSISLPGIKIETKIDAPPITDSKIAVTRMLETLKKHNKKVLITIDEVVSNASVKLFCGVFQILLRQDLPIYLIMTGLYENINVLKNEKTLTFLYRAPKIILKPIEIASVARSYAETFNMPLDKAKKMAALTKGYPFAFQILGYYTWENDGDFNSCLDTYKEYLFDYVYEKIWAELSPKDKVFVVAIAKSESGKTKEIKEILDISQSEYNPYRKRLLDKGVIQTGERGSVDFSLPFFSEFAMQMEEI